MPGPNWDDEDNNMYPTCADAGQSGQLSGQEVAFLAQLMNVDRPSVAEATELLRIWRAIQPSGGS